MFSLEFEINFYSDLSKTEYRIILHKAANINLFQSYTHYISCLGEQKPKKIPSEGVKCGHFRPVFFLHFL